MIYKHETYILEIKYILKDVTIKGYTFIIEDLKTGKVYKQQYSLKELVYKFKILSIYPHMFSQLVKKFPSLVKDHEPLVNIENGIYADSSVQSANITWNIFNPLGEKEIIMLNIKEKIKDCVSNEVLELKQENAILIKKIDILQDELKSIKMLQNTTLVSVKSNIKLIIEFPELIKIMMDNGVDLINDPQINTLVQNMLMLEYCAASYEIDKLKGSKYNYIRELIKVGYSVTNPCMCIDPNPFFGNTQKIKISHLMNYIMYCVRGCNLNSATKFDLFKDVIKLFLPTADLNICYNEIGTIMEWLVTQLTNSVYNTQEHINCVRKALSYFLSIGAKR